VKSLSQTSVERIRELRKSQGWTQQGLADRLNHLGAQTDRAAVAKVETHKRGLALNAAFQYALALNVAPVHLFVPVGGPPGSANDPPEPIMLGPNLTCSPAEARKWIRGELPIYPYQDPRIYFAMVPREEHHFVVEDEKEDPS
jgi:transcriptional regulator with XRE-family HTH domain